MGKRIISQRRGGGSPTYRSPSHRYRAQVRHLSMAQETKGKVADIIHCPGHSSPIAKIVYENGEENHIIAPEGICVDQKISVGGTLTKGSCIKLINIPEGTQVYNIESQPGDGGKFVRSSGLSAKVVAKRKNKVIVLLPSKKEKAFDPNCRANIGIIAGSGRTEKPLVKAGKNYHRMHARNKLYPKVCGISMNAVDHPFGTSRSSKKGHPTIAKRNKPPGAKVGKIRPRRTGRKK